MNNIPSQRCAAEEVDDEEDSFLFEREALPAPSADASIEDHLEFIHYQLDCLTEASGTILYGLVMLGERLQGGQAVVQMAKHKHSRDELAIKFFARREDYDSEAALYSDKQSGGLSAFLMKPEALVDNLQRDFLDPSGHPLPPCIVMERGVALDVWLQRALPDKFQAFTMVYHLAKQLEGLHASGFAHRDLKPGNVMWQPSSNRWILIDFGCAARIGTMHDLALTISYAAPEVIAEYRNRSRKILVSEAVDSWSLGVIAFELLTGKPVVRSYMGREKIMNQIEGKNGESLPWEDITANQNLLSKLGVFQQSVLQLLNRDSFKRTSMSTFCADCDRLLGSPVNPTPGKVDSTAQGMATLPCGCKVPSIVAEALLKVGQCSECRRDLTPTPSLTVISAQDETVTIRQLDPREVHEQLNLPPRDAIITDLKQLADRLTATACVPDLWLENRTLELPEAAKMIGAAKVFEDTVQQWQHVEMWPVDNNKLQGNSQVERHEGRFCLTDMKGADGHYIVCLEGAAVSVRAGHLNLEGKNKAALVLKLRNGSSLHDITVQGGLLVVYGDASNVLLQQCTLRQCTLVVLGGAKVTLDRCTLSSDLGIYASGQSTIVKATGGTTITPGRQGVVVDNGACFDATALEVAKFSDIGIEARGQSTSLNLTRCKLWTDSSALSRASFKLRGLSIVVHSYSAAVVRDCSIQTTSAGLWAVHHARLEASACMISSCVMYGVCIEQSSTATLRSCKIEDITRRRHIRAASVIALGAGTEVTAEKCHFLRSRAGVSAQNRAKVRLIDCQSENNQNGFEATGAAAIEALRCVSDADGDGIIADSSSQVTAENLIVLNATRFGAKTEDASTLKLLDASIAGCDRCAVYASGSNTKMEVSKGAVLHRSSSAAVSVIAGANLKMQDVNVSVSSSTQTAFEAIGPNSSLHLTSCRAFVSTLYEAPMRQGPLVRSQIASLMMESRAIHDSRQVYCTDQGTIIRTIDCQPDLLPEPVSVVIPPPLPAKVTPATSRKRRARDCMKRVLKVCGAVFALLALPFVACIGFITAHTQRKHSKDEPDPPMCNSYMPETAPAPCMFPQAPPTHRNGGYYSMAHSNYYNYPGQYGSSAYSSPYSHLPPARASPSLPQGTLQPAVSSHSEQPTRSSIDKYGDTATMVSALNWANYKDREKEMAKSLEALLQQLESSPEKQIPISGTHFLDNLALPSEPLSAESLSAPGRHKVKILARSSEIDRQVTVTFYEHQSQLDEEERLWSHSKLKESRILPLLTDRNTSGHWRTEAGTAVPVYTITPCGNLQNLSDWASSEKPGFVSCVIVMCGVVSKLAALHHLGYTHGSLALGSIVRETGEDTPEDSISSSVWKFRDSFASKTGSEAYLPSKAELTQYSAPETVLQCISAEAHATAPLQTSADVWAVGIMLLELLSGRSLQSAMHVAVPVDTAAGREGDNELPSAAIDKLKAAASGVADFPWEPQVRGSVRLLSRLRGLKSIILQCLLRDPADRPSARKILQVLASFTGGRTVEGIDALSDDSTGPAQ